MADIRRVGFECSALYSRTLIDIPCGRSCANAIGLYRLADLGDAVDSISFGYSNKIGSYGLDGAVIERLCSLSRVQYSTVP